MEISKIFENNKDWIAEKLKANPNFFKDIPTDQKPDFLYIGCSDSRLRAEDFMGLKEGDVFVHRNIANQVIPQDNNLASVIHFAVAVLQVKHIVVCGHYGCGGVLAAMSETNVGPIEPWIKGMRELYSAKKDDLAQLSPEIAYRKFVELNILNQCRQLLEFEEISSKIKDGKIQIHAWVYDMHNGQLSDLSFGL